MNKKQQAQYDSSLRAKDFVALYHDVLNANPEFVLLLVIFNDLLEKIEDARSKQASDTTIYSPDKKMLKFMMASLVIKFAKRGAAKAYLIPDKELLRALDRAIYYITAVDDDTAADRSNYLKQTMKDNLNVLTNLHDTDIDAMTQAIDAFINKKPVPKEKIKQKKSQGTDPIPALSIEMEGCKKQMGNIVHSSFSSLANTWDGFVKIGIAPGTRKLMLSLKILDDTTSTRLRNVKVTLANNTETMEFKSSRMGSLRVYSLEEGNWTITSELAGYDTDIKRDVAIKAYEIKRIEVRLKKRE